jgi:hypothetical protein
LEVGFDGLHFFVFAFKVEIAKTKIILEFNGLVSVLIDLGLQFSLGSNNLSLERLSDLGFLLG